MTLLVLDQFSELGGAQQCLLDLLPAMQSRGWQVAVGLPGDGPLAARLRGHRVETAAIDCGPYASGRKTLADMGRFLAGSSRLARQVRELAARFHPDAIYVNGPRLLPAVAGAGWPVIFHSHSFLPPGPARTLCGFALRQANARVIGNCRFVAGPWMRFAGAERVKVIYNGVPGPDAPVERPASAAFTVGCVGRIAPEKGQLEFVRAAAIMHRELPQCRFSIHGASVLAGPAYEREVRAAAQALPVEFAGWSGDVNRALAGLDVLLVPSAPQEATTRVIPEAFAAGTPVIAFASGGIPEIVEHGRTGLLVKDAGEMARAAIELLRGCRRRAAITAAARESWRERFTLGAWQNSVLDFIGVHLCPSVA